MNFKKIFLLLLVTLLFVGISHATEASDDTTDTRTVDTSTTKEVVVQSSNTLIKESDNNIFSLLLQ